MRSCRHPDQTPSLLACPDLPRRLGSIRHSDSPLPTEKPGESRPRNPAKRAANAHFHCINWLEPEGKPTEPILVSGAGSVAVVGSGTPPVCPSFVDALASWEKSSVFVVYGLRSLRSTECIDGIQYLNTQLESVGLVSIRFYIYSLLFKLSSSYSVCFQRDKRERRA